MISNNIPSNLGNLVAPFLPAGQRPVGQETAANRNSTFKPVEQSAKAAETRVRRKSEENPQEKDLLEKDSREKDPRGEDGEKRQVLAEQVHSDPEHSHPEQHRSEQADSAQTSPETPSSRLAQRFASTDAGHRMGSRFDQTI